MKKLTLVALLTAIAFTPAAFAQSANSSVTYSNFHYTLTDLTPTDGLAPSATFTFQSSLYGTGSDPRIDKRASSTNDVISQNITLSAPGSNVNASTTAGTGQQHLSGASASASGSATITGHEIPSAGGQQYNSYNSTAYIYNGTFTLAPGSQITFYADVHAFASSDTGATNDDSRAQATGWLSGSAGYNYFSNYVQVNAIHNNDFGLKTDEKTQTLQITFSNYDIKPLTGYLYAHADVSGAAVNILAVPEPSTYAMFFAGLGLIAFAKRRRK